MLYSICGSVLLLKMSTPDSVWRHIFSAIAFCLRILPIECFFVLDSIPGRSDIIYVCIQLLSLVVTGPSKRPRLYGNGHITTIAYKMIALNLNFPDSLSWFAFSRNSLEHVNSVLFTLSIIFD